MCRVSQELFDEHAQGIMWRILTRLSHWQEAFWLVIIFIQGSSGSTGAQQPLKESQTRDSSAAKKALQINVYKTHRVNSEMFRFLYTIIMYNDILCSLHVRIMYNDILCSLNVRIMYNDILCSLYIKIMYNDVLCSLYVKIMYNEVQ